MRKLGQQIMTSLGARGIAMLAIGVVITTLLVVIDYQLIDQSITLLTGEPSVIPIAFTVATTVCPALAALIRARARAGLRGFAGNGLAGLFIAMWLITVAVVTFIRILASTTGNDDKADNSEGAGLGAVPPSQWEVFLVSFDPFDSDVVIAFAMVVSLLMTGLVAYFVTAASHDPLRALRERSKRLAAEAVRVPAEATAEQAVAAEAVAAWAPDEAEQRDDADFAASVGALNARADAVAERLRLRMASLQGDAEATTRLMRPVRQNMAQN